MTLPDVQAEKSCVPLRKVGIRGIKKHLEFTGQSVFTEISTYVNLKDGRGVHMSRFIENLSILNKVSTANISGYLALIKSKQEAEVSFLTLRFEKEIHDQFIKFKIDANSMKDSRYTIKFTFQIIATCPCSLELCKNANKGVPHMQRGFATVCVSVDAIEDTVPVVSECMGSFKLIMPRSFIKRPTEHEIAVNCEADPVFVEDVVRRIKAAINLLPFVNDFYIVVEHEESIHTHNAVAIDSKFDPVLHPLE